MVYGEAVNQSESSILSKSHYPHIFDLVKDSVANSIKQNGKSIAFSLAMITDSLSTKKPLELVRWPGFQVLSAPNEEVNVCDF
jgi:hypothetical protein